MVGMETVVEPLVGAVVVAVVAAAVVVALEWKANVVVVEAGPEQVPIGKAAAVEFR